MVYGLRRAALGEDICRRQRFPAASRHRYICARLCRCAEARPGQTDERFAPCFLEAHHQSNYGDFREGSGRLRPQNVCRRIGRPLGCGSKEARQWCDYPHQTQNR